MGLDHNIYKTKRANFLPSLEGPKERPTRVQLPGPAKGIFSHPEIKSGYRITTQQQTSYRYRKNIFIYFAML